MREASKLSEQMICGNDCVICVMKWILWINFTIGTSSAISTNKCNKYQIMFKVSTFPHSNCWKWKAFWWIEEKNWIVIHLVAENACEEIEMEYLILEWSIRKYAEIFWDKGKTRTTTMERENKILIIFFC